MTSLIGKKSYPSKKEVFKNAPIFRSKFFAIEASTSSLLFSLLQESSVSYLCMQNSGTVGVCWIKPQHDGKAVDSKNPD